MSAKVLILDEPTASLDAREVQMLFQVMRSLTAQGIAIILITHFLDQVYQISDRITVLRNGEKVGEHRTQELPKRQLILLMLGREFAEIAAAGESPAAFVSEGAFVQGLAAYRAQGDAASIRPQYRQRRDRRLGRGCSAPAERKRRSFYSGLRAATRGISAREGEDYRAQVAT